MTLDRLRGRKRRFRLGCTGWSELTKGLGTAVQAGLSLQGSEMSLHLNRGVLFEAVDQGLALRLWPEHRSIELRI